MRPDSPLLRRGARGEVMEKCSTTLYETSLDQKFWDGQWANNDTGWDMGQVSPPLKEYVDQLERKDLRILIPGCGNTYEAEYLLQNGFTNVTVIDISPTLVDKLKKKFAGQLGKTIHILCADFFELKGEFDLVLEQTFFCALEPKLRMKYVWKMEEILAKGGHLTGVMFNRTFEFDGPPFGGSKQEYEMLFAPYFKFKTFEACYNSYPKRAGTELFINLIKN